MKTIVLAANSEEDNMFWEAGAYPRYLPLGDIIPIKELGLTTITSANLIMWNKLYSNPFGIFDSEEDEEHFLITGEILYKQVIEELKDKYYVVYFDEALIKVVDYNK